MLIELINKEKSSIKEVLDILEKQKNGTEWAKTSNDWAMNRAIEFSKVNNENWVKGLLPLEYLGEILLPTHIHKNKNGEGDAPFIIPEDTPVSQVLPIYKRRANQSNSECLQNIDYLKEQIKTAGFINEIILGVKIDNLCHIDGLHRIIALISLLDEGMDYSPIKIYLTRPL